jgi:hypothetical protein
MPPGEDIGPFGKRGFRTTNSQRAIRRTRMPQDFKSNSLSFFAAVPNWPSWYMAAPAGEKVNGANGSASIWSRYSRMIIL